MKKYISLIVALFVFINTIPMAVSADEVTSGEATLIDKAVSVFPEFGNKLKSPDLSNVANSRSVLNNTIIYSETRSISESELLTYTEYSNGMIILTGINVDAKEPTIVTNSYYASSFAYNYDISITAGAVGCTDYFHLNNVQYSLIRDSYDCFTSLGTPVCEDLVGEELLNYQVTETASQNAYISYHLNFQFGPSGAYRVDTVLTVEVGDNSMRVTHEDW